MKPIRLSAHEKIMLVVYRCLDADEQRSVDIALSAAWTRERPYDSARNDLFGKAIRDLNAGTARDTEILAYFANVGRTAGAR
jgi:hypothetical protein